MIHSWKWRVNAMEQRFLHLIEYNVAITRQLYTRIYFELRELCERREVQLPLRPLSVAELDTIEGRADATKSFARRKLVADIWPTQI